MSIPKLVQEHLESAEINHQQIELPEASSLKGSANFLEDRVKHLVRAVTFRGGDKPIVAVLPYTHLLDIKQLELAIEQEAVLLAPEANHRLFKGCQEGSWAPISGAFEAVFFVDKSVLEFEQIIIQSGNPKLLLQLEKTETNKLYQNANIADFAAGSERLYAGRNSVSDEPSDLDISFTPIRLKQRVDETFDLPAMPEIAQDIMKLRVDPSADATKLAQIVCRDPSLAAQVISWASSPYYGYQGKVDSVETAIARVLGFELVMNLALGISIGKSLKVPMEGPLGIRQFWKQAIYSANLAEKICRNMPIKQRPERGLIYLSGLLHNFGHLLLGHIFPPQFELVNRTIEANPHIAVEDIEFYILGVNHEEIGAWLMANWHMPDELIVAVQRHHQEEFWSKHAVYSNIVLVANRMLKRLGIGDATETDIPNSTLELLSLDIETLESTLQDIESEAETLDLMAKQLVA